MGYHITLARPEPKPAITEQEWRQFVLSRPELTLEPAEVRAHMITAILDAQENLALHYCKGDVFTKNPDGPRIISYMVSIASHFEAVVTGDEGETYATEADWGTQTDWNTPPMAAPKPIRKWELSRGKRVVAGLLLGALVVAIREFFRSR